MSRNKGPRRRWLWPLALGAVPGLLAGQEPCNTDLTPLPGEFGYEKKEGTPPRCEGFYDANVLGTVLHLTGLYGAKEANDPAVDGTITLGWHAADTTRHVLLQVNGLEERVSKPYRMDAVLSPKADASSMEWPLGFLRAQQMTFDDIGALAWQEQQVESGDGLVYLPLQVYKGTRPASGGRYLAFLFPRATLDELFVSVRRVGALDYVWDDQILDRGPYAALEAIEVQLPPLDEGGVYEIEVSADPIAGPALPALTFYLHHHAGQGGG